MSGTPLAREGGQQAAYGGQPGRARRDVHRDGQQGRPGGGHATSHRIQYRPSCIRSCVRIHQAGNETGEGVRCRA
ncbi:hypothetical protein Mame01_59460 [Microbispora amethystogenes]|nr:hypothetical protein Mame01_59460 [Microbispora amethystogenes]